MRRPNRNIDIFSISALDLFASALGAFILIAIILFPYYLKDRQATDQLAVMDASLRDERAARLEAQEELTRQADAMSAMKPPAEPPGKSKQPIAKPFLQVGIRWTVPSADIDLHVTDPLGNEFSWFKTNAERRDYPNSTAELSYAMTTGPAVVVWQDPSVMTGQYKVEYVANVVPEGYRVDVKGSIISREGIKDLAPRTLRKTGERILAATLIVNADGAVTLR